MRSLRNIAPLFCSSTCRIAQIINSRHFVSKISVSQMSKSTQMVAEEVKIRSRDTFMNGLSSVDGSTNSIGRGALIDGPPKFESPYEHRRYVLERMAGAFRVIARKGYLAGTAGHISVRDPVDPDTFWINS
jgi:Class II Aldolase and Adducin N-terminal domain